MKKLGVPIVPRLGGPPMKIEPWQLSEAAKRDIAEIEHNARCALDRINASGWPYSIKRPASVDGRRMAETGTGSGRSPTSAVGSEASETPPSHSEAPDNG